MIVCVGMHANYSNGMVNYTSHNISIQENGVVYFAFYLVESLLDIEQEN